MARPKQSGTGRTRAVPYPAPKTGRLEQLMLGVMQGLGKLPDDDDGLEDRIVACMLVAWGELAAMQDSKRRDDILATVGGWGRTMVDKLLIVAREAQASEAAQSQVDKLYEAVRKGEAKEVPLPGTPKSRH